MKKKCFHQLILPLLILSVLGGQVVSTQAQTQLPTVWSSQYHPLVATTETVVKVKTDSQNNVIVLANNWSGTDGDHGMHVSKYAATDGHLLWQLGNGVVLPETASDLAIDRHDNIVITGSLAGTALGNACTEKYSPDGVLLWKQSHAVDSTISSTATALALDGFGNVFITGFIFIYSTPVLYAAKYQALTGDVIWETAAADFKSGGEALALDHQGDMLIVGQSGVIKLDGGTGKVLWHSKQGKYLAVAVDGHDDVFAAGDRYYSYSDDGGPLYQLKTIKLKGQTGQVSWVHLLDDPLDSRARDLAIDSHNNVIILGIAARAALDYDYGIYTGKLKGSDGSPVWEKYFNGHLRSLASQLAITPAGDVFLTGTTVGRHSTHLEYNFVYLTLGYAGADGTLLSATAYDSVLQGNDIGESIALDRAGDVIVSGESPETLGGSTALTIKYQH